MKIYLGKEVCRELQKLDSSILSGLLFYFHQCSKSRRIFDERFKKVRTLSDKDFPALKEEETRSFSFRIQNEHNRFLLLNLISRKEAHILSFRKQNIELIVSDEKGRRKVKISDKEKNTFKTERKKILASLNLKKPEKTMELK